MGPPTQTETNLMLRVRSERSNRLIISTLTISILEQGEGDVAASDRIKARTTYLKIGC